MLKKILSTVFIFFNLLLNAQVMEKITVKAGEDISKTLSAYGTYRFPVFINGTVNFRDKSTGAGKMNYNIFLGEVQFVDDKGDTLALANPETIESIAIDTNIFYYRKGYLQVIAHYNAARLVMRQKIEFRPVKLGAYGNQSPGNSIENYGKTTTSPYVNNNQLTLNEDILVLKTTSYYLFYGRFKETDANRRGFLSLFPDQKNTIAAFIETNNIDFSNAADLKKLLSYCVETQDEKR